MSENTGTSPNIEGGSTGPNFSSESNLTLEKIKSQYPHIEDVYEPFLNTDESIERAEEKLTAKAEEVNPATGEKQVVETNYLKIVSAIMDQAPSVESLKSFSADKVGLLNALEDRIRNYGFYRTQNDPLYDITKKYKDKDLLLAAVEFQRAQLLRQVRSQIESGAGTKLPKFNESWVGKKLHDKNLKDNTYTSEQYKVAEVIYGKKDVHPPHHPTEPPTIIPVPQTLEEAAGLVPPKVPEDQAQSAKKIIGEGAPRPKSNKGTVGDEVSEGTLSAEGSDQTAEDTEDAGGVSGEQTFTPDPRDKAEIPIETDQIRLKTSVDESGDDTGHEKDEQTETEDTSSHDTEEHVTEQIDEEPEAESLQETQTTETASQEATAPESGTDTKAEEEKQPEPEAALPAPASETQPEPDAAPAEIPHEEKTHELSETQEHEKSHEREEPTDLTSAPLAIPEKKQGPRYKDGIILTAAAAQNRLEDQIKAMALHLRAEEPGGKGLMGWLRRNVVHRALQNRLLRNVFIGREMRYAADIDKVAKQALGINGSVSLAITPDFAVTALKEGMKRLNSQPWYKKWPKKALYAPLRFISGTTGIIQSPDQWEARGWIKNSPEAKKMLQDIFKRSLVEQNSLGKRFELHNTTFNDINQTSIDSMNEHVLSLEKGETRRYYDLPKEVQNELKRKIELYAGATFAAGSEDEMIANMNLLSEVNALLKDKVFNTIPNKADRNELLSSELASNIISVAQDVRGNRNFYLDKDENGQSKLDSLEMKFLAGQAWWGKARQAEATGIIGRSINERMARRLSKRNYRWDRVGHKGVNMVSNLIMDVGVNAGVYAGGWAAFTGENVFRQGARVMGPIGGSLGIATLNGLKEMGLMRQKNGELRGIGGNYLSEFVQYSHEAALGREDNPAFNRIRKELEQITVKRMSADEWIRNIDGLMNDASLDTDQSKRDQLLSLVVDAKARMRLTDISSKKEGMKLAAVQNFIQYTENAENEQAYKMHELLVNAAARLGSLPHKGNISENLRNLTLVRAAQLRMGDNTDAIERTINADLKAEGKPGLSKTDVATFHQFLRLNHLTVGNDESLESKYRLLNKLARRKAGRAFVGTALTAGAMGLVVPVVKDVLADNIQELHGHISYAWENREEVAEGIKKFMAQHPDETNREIVEEFQEWRAIFGDRRYLPVWAKDGRLTTELNDWQRAALRVRAAITDVAPTHSNSIEIEGEKIRLPDGLKFVEKAEKGYRGIVDLRTGEVLDFSGGRTLDIDDGKIILKAATGRPMGEISEFLTGIKVTESAGTHMEALLADTGGVHEGTLTLNGRFINNTIPEGTHWRVDPDNSNAAELVLNSNPDKVLVDNVHLNADGKVVGSVVESGIKMDMSGGIGETKIITGEESMQAWKEMSSPIKNGEHWWTNNTARSEGNELGLYNRVEVAPDGRRIVVLDGEFQENAIRHATLGDRTIDAHQMAQDNKIVFTFRLAGHYDEPIIVQAKNGILRLDPTDTTNFVYGADGNELMIDGHKVTVAEFSNMVLNQEALKDIPEGSLASELTNRPEVFNLQPDGSAKSGFISAGFKADDGSINQLATIRGRGDFDSIEFTSGSDINLKVDLSKDIEIPGDGIKITTKDLPITFTTEPWFTDIGWPVGFTPIPLYARQNIERSRPGKKQPSPIKDETPQDITPAPGKPEHDQEPEKPQMEEPSEEPAPEQSRGITPLPATQSPDRTPAEGAAPVPNTPTAPASQSPVTTDKSGIKVPEKQPPQQPEKTQTEEEIQAEEEKTLITVPDDSPDTIKARVNLSNEIARDEALLRNPLKASPNIRVRLENNRRRLQQLDAELERGPTPNLNTPLPQVRTAYFTYKQQALPKYVQELRNDIRSAQSNRGMSYAEFEKKWGIPTGMAEYRLQSNMDERAVQGRLRQQFILNTLAEDTINKITDPAVKDRITQIQSRIRSGAQVPVADYDFYAQQVTERVNQRVIDQQQFFNIIREWEQENRSPRPNTNPLLQASQSRVSTQAQSSSKISTPPSQVQTAEAVLAVPEQNIQLKVAEAKKNIFERTENHERTKEEMQTLIDTVVTIQKEALNTGNGKMMETIEAMKASGQKEMIVDGLVTYIPESQRVISVGDIHGDYKTVKHIIEKEQFIENMESGKKDTTLVFMGDIVDRGKKNAEVVEAILELKRRYPNNVVLMRADHEDYALSDKYGGISDLNKRYGDKKVVENLYHEVFGRMPRLVVTGNGVVFTHGGPSPYDLNLKQMSSIRDNHNIEALFDGAMAWGDPTTRKDIQNERAAHKVYTDEIDSLITAAKNSPSKKARASFGNEYSLDTLELLRDRVVAFDKAGAWINLERINYNNTGQGIFGALSQNLIFYSPDTVNNFLKKVGGTVLVRGHQTSDGINSGTGNVIGSNFLNLHSTGRGSEDSHYAVREWNPKYAVFDANMPVTQIDQNKNVRLVWPNQT